MPYTNAGTVVETLEEVSGSRMRVLRLDCTASGGDIVYNITKCDTLKGSILMQVDVQPIVAPTASSDLYIYKECGGKASGLDFENMVTTTPTETASSSYPIMWGQWTIDVDNNVVAAARVIIKMYFYKL